jgi:hypothetical protein
MHYLNDVHGINTKAPWTWLCVSTFHFLKFDVLWKKSGEEGQHQISQENLILTCIRLVKWVEIEHSVWNWLRAGRSRSRSSSPRRVKNFLFSTSCRTALGPIQLRIQWVTGALTPGVKWPGCEADLPPPTSAEVKKTWFYTSTLAYVFMA